MQPLGLHPAILLSHEHPAHPIKLKLPVRSLGSKVIAKELDALVLPNADALCRAVGGVREQLDVLSGNLGDGRGHTADEGGVGRGDGVDDGSA